MGYETKRKLIVRITAGVIALLMFGSVFLSIVLD